MKHRTKEQLINFEKRIYDSFERGDLPYLIHLCGGNEEQLISIFERIREGDYIFSSHRTHYHYLLAGGSEEDLENKINSGDSMFVFNKKLKFFSSSILAGTACIAAGVAQSLKFSNSSNKVWCFLGDGAEDEGHLYEAVRYVDGWGLPCTFIIEDNNRSVETSKLDRRGPNYTRFSWPSCVETYTYTPVFPHASTGSGKMVKFNKEPIERYLNEI
jgi:TPP-dependent pyruvate/acetoin dehydrogenase alpha subunit